MSEGIIAEKDVSQDIQTLIGLLQLSDSFFPSGMYTMSNGLESYFYRKKVRNANQLHELIKVYLEQQIGPADCNALGNSYAALENHNIQRLIEVDQTLFAMRIVEEVRNASTRSGMQVLRCISSFVTDNAMLLRYQEAIKQGKASGIYPVSLAIATNVFGISKHNAGIILLYGFIVSMTGAALRLGILHHYDAQRIIHELKPIISDTVIKNINRPLSGIWQFCPDIDINQMKHEKMHSKMFIT